MTRKIRDVRDLVLVLPEPAAIPAAGVADLQVEPDAPRLARGRFSSADRLPGGWRGWFARSLRRDDLAGVDTASVVAALRGSDFRGAWLATPLQLAAGLQTVHVPADGILEMQADEASAWCHDFSRVFGADGLRLEPFSPTALVLSGLEAPGVVSVEPSMLLGRSLEGAQPQGAQASRLRALMGELEMWLHEHPLNIARQHRGQASIASLWLWGGGGSAGEALPERAAAGTGWARLYADDPWVAALAGLSSVPLLPPPVALDGTVLDGSRSGRVGLVVSPARLAAGARSGAWAGWPEAVDRLYVRPAMEALASGVLAGLTLVAGDRATRLCVSDRFRLWRPARTWARALVD